jgi:competence protein ComEA
MDAVSAAGGPAPGADLQRVNLAQPLADGERWYIPEEGVESVPSVVNPDSAHIASSPGSTSGSGVTNAGGGIAPSPIHLNTATVEELETLPGVGPAIAAAIVRHREANGPFASVDALLDVPGVGEGRLANWRELLLVP